MTYPILLRRATLSRVWVSTPSSVMLPEVGSISRLIMRIEVVFPQPEGPTSVVILPFGAVMVSLSTETVPSGYTLETLSKVIMSFFLAE
jgi:hypothetical protein